jgi:hypothetical protein
VKVDDHQKQLALLGGDLEPEQSDGGSLSDIQIFLEHSQTIKNQAAQQQYRMRLIQVIVEIARLSSLMSFSSESSVRSKASCVLRPLAQQ